MRIAPPRRLGPTIAGILLAVGGPAGASAGPPAAEILRRAEEVRSPEKDYAVDFTLRIVSPETVWKERTAAYTMVAHGKDYSLILMREPRSFYPGTLLIAKGLYWLLLSRSDKPLQLAPRVVLNGDISNGDLARGNLSTLYEPRLDGEETVAGQPCWRLELIRASDRALYARIRCWITKEGFLPWKLEYYGSTGSLLKTAHYEDYRDGALGLRAMRIVVRNHVRPGEVTTMTFSGLRELDVSAFPFDPQTLPLFRDAAQAFLEAEGVQVRAEDLAGLLGAGGP